MSDPEPQGRELRAPAPEAFAFDPAEALEALPAEVAVLDEDGRVVFGNLAWRAGRGEIVEGEAAAEADRRKAPLAGSGVAARLDYPTLVAASTDAHAEGPDAMRSPADLEACVRAVLGGSLAGCRGRVSLPGAAGIRHYVVDVAPLARGGAVVTQVDATDLVEEHRELECRALTDGLTRLLDHQAFHAQARGAIANALRHGRTLHVLMIDLDDFKWTNDRLGHHVGDQVLIAIARRLEGSVREGDLVGRLGGDEFAVLTQETQDAAVLVDRLEAAIGEPVQVGDALVAPGCTIGWAALPEDGRAIDDLLKVADARMYMSKGRPR